MSQFLPLNGNVTPIWTNQVHNVLANLISKKYGQIPLVEDDLALVLSLNGIQGHASIVAGTNVTVTTSGQDIIVSSTGGGGGGGVDLLVNCTLWASDVSSIDFASNTSALTITGIESMECGYGIQFDLDGDLKAIAALTGTGYLQKTGVNTWGLATPTVSWGSITGTLSSQTDLNTALNGKVSKAGDTMSGALTISSTTVQNLFNVSSTASYTEVGIKNPSNNPTGISLYGNNANPVSDIVYEFGATPRLVIGRWQNSSYDSGGALSIFSNRNVNIGTGTGDPGYKLRVQGTLRVQGKVQLEGSTSTNPIVNFPTGGTLSSPADGDFWREAGDNAVYLRIGTNTRYLYHSGNLGVFTSGTSGLVSASGGGTTNFLRADGTWAAPSTGGVAWGAITGTLSSQTDLQTALNGKQATIGYTPANKAGDTFTGNTGVQGTMSAYYHASTNGTIGSQYVNFGMFSSGGVVQWQWGWESDRSFALWSYNDSGTYVARPMNILRDGTAVYFTGRMFGNGGGNGIGALTLTTTSGTPSGGSSGDIKLVY